MAEKFTVRDFFNRFSDDTCCLDVVSKKVVQPLPWCLEGEG